MSTFQIHVFISHAWAYSDDYDTLASWIFGEPWKVGQTILDLRDYSVPSDDPIHDANNARELRDAIFNQIARSHVVVIPLGMYATYSKWIQKEIDGAIEYEKPILAVIPRGQERVSSIVDDCADDVVGWTKNSVVSGIWNLYRKSNATD